jgi:colicin import membrane protein
MWQSTWVVVAVMMGALGCKKTESEHQVGNPAEQSANQAQKASEQALDEARKAQDKASQAQRESTEAQQKVVEKQRDLANAQQGASQAAQQAQQAQQQAQQQASQATQRASGAQQQALEAQRKARTMAQAEQQTGTESANNPNPPAATPGQTQNPSAQALPEQNPSAQTQPEQNPPAQTQPEQNPSAQTQPEQNPSAETQPEQNPQAAAPVAAPAAGQQQPLTATGSVSQATVDELVLARPGAPELHIKLEPGTQVTVDGQQAEATDLTEGNQVRVSYRMVADQPIAIRVDAAPSATRQGRRPPPR